MGTKIGYARAAASTGGIEKQVEELTRAGCVQVFHDHKAKASFPWPGLRNALDTLRSGDTLVVTDISRVSRKMIEIVELAQLLRDRGARVESLTQSIDLQSPEGEFLFHLSAARAQRSDA